MQPIGQLKQVVALFPVGLTKGEGQNKHLPLLRYAEAGHVSQTEASEEQVLQPVGQLKQVVALFPAGLTVFPGHAVQTPLLR
jgi:hypothetical protein